MVFRFKLSLPFLLLIALVSCSKNNTVAIENLPAGELAEQRWQFMLARDFEQAYEYETPAYRGAYTPELFAYQFNGGVDWREIKLLDSKEISDDLMEVQLELKYLFDEGGDFEQLLSSNITEDWIKVDGHWWHVPEN